MSAKRDSLIELKGAMLPILSVILHSLDLEQLREEAKRMFGEESFFDGDLAALDLNHIAIETLPSLPDWSALSQLFVAHGLRIIGTRGGDISLAVSASAAGLPPLALSDSPSRAQTPAPPPPAEPVMPAEPAPFSPSPTNSNTLIIDRPLRSGQQIYARGGDAIVLAAVSPGAEVIADGSIHVYAPLRGRALAGASGNTRARILTTHMEAELVSVAGLYRTFEDGVPPLLLGKPTQIRLIEEGSGGNSRLAVEALAIS